MTLKPRVSVNTLAALIAPTPTERNIFIHLQTGTVTWHFMAATKAVAKYPEEILASVSRDISSSSMYELKTRLLRVLVSSTRSNITPYSSHCTP
jgi:hypothetical protein